MKAAIQPKAWHRRWINEAVRAEINLCFTCGSCAVECPVNRATQGLDPRRLVWMANLGLMEDLLRLLDLWLCLECRKCSHVCPMTVKPSALIAFLRWEAVREGVVDEALSDQRRRLQERLHRERAGVVRDLLEQARDGGKETAHSASTPLSWKRFARFHGHDTHVASCFACGECSNACPVCVDRSVLDPLVLVRSALLGYGREAIMSPAPWLCLQCRSCSRACSHHVQGHLVALALREEAERQGWVDAEFLKAWHEKDKVLFQKHAERVGDAYRLLLKEPSSSPSAL
ncbi:MAG: 4Fe-4S dicluster domain-containing protein [Desulfosoma sp.]|uniref:4Fe-4S dicluster domain-containing protein n=1 Tax=Desulfosoma sp. TaxID=2603217 RepID=UPI00404AC10B